MIEPGAEEELCPKCARTITWTPEGFGPFCDGCGLHTDRCPCQLSGGPRAIPFREDRIYGET